MNWILLKMKNWLPGLQVELMCTAQSSYCSASAPAPFLLFQLQASSRQCLLVCCMACSEIEVASEQPNRQYLVF